MRMRSRPGLGGLLQRVSDHADSRLQAEERAVLAVRASPQHQHQHQHQSPHPLGSAVLRRLLLFSTPL